MAFLYSCTLSGMGPWRYGSVDACGLGGGRPHASYALGREGRDTIWLNGLFRGFAVHNVLAGKVAIGQCGCVAGA